MKNKITVIFTLMLLSSSLVLAAEPIPVDLGEVQLPDNFLINALEPVLEKISILVGGIFGIYVILTLLQIRREQKKIKLLQQIHYDLDLLTKHFGVKHPESKKGLFRRVLSIIRGEKEGKKSK